MPGPSDDRGWDALLRLLLWTFVIGVLIGFALSGILFTIVSLVGQP